MLPSQIVVDLQSSPQTTGGYSLYALAKLGPPHNIDNVAIDNVADDGRRTGVLSTWGSVRPAKVQQLQHTFDQRLMFDGLSVARMAYYWFMRPPRPATAPRAI